MIECLQAVAINPGWWSRDQKAKDRAMARFRQTAASIAPPIVPLERMNREVELRP